ncbi:aldo/keto reductase [Paracoccus aminophilus]|uniref:Aldo/keto reductase family oxidoreductase n=1 Tax=Paracoccus aminophilus JCM 7686 TaxID=1367847 RepID=S5XZY0_PARAH|nr:aldo/keto reductase [Paracoccus aminophilus]AGT10852.1 aldo/keto reductase family oxidoreductase [Paracoccus aminophilus JCM 7686]
MEHRLFGTTGVSSATLVLGTGTFGTGWGHGADLATSRAVLDGYLEAGGNHIDTADVYQFGQSEEFLGELLAGRRDEIFLASKFTNGASPQTNALNLGNSRRAMVTSVEASLRRLNTDRLDLLWVHHPDHATPSDEILRGLDDLARAGKILYAGLSNFPAWRVARAVTLAEMARTLPIAAVQFEYSLVLRDAEAELIPAAEALGLAQVAWSPLGGGLLTGKYRRGEQGRAEAFGGKVFQPEDSAQKTAVLDAVLDIAAKRGVSPDQVAIAWVLARGPFTLIGPRNPAQLTSNLGARDVALTPEELARLTEISTPVRAAPTASASGRSHDALQSVA